MENVKALISNKFINDFREWQNEVAKRGYTNFVKVMNSKSYNVPQNRERVFMISILDDNASYHFPEPFPLERRLKDILEDNVDEKYYLSDKLLKYIFSNGGKDGNIKGGTGVCDDSSVVSPTLTAQYYKTGRQSVYMKEPICLNPKVDGKQPSLEHRIYSVQGISTAVTTGFMPSIAEPQVLTPKRNEYGKSVRKEYESGMVNESRHNMTDLKPRIDNENSCASTVTTAHEPKCYGESTGYRIRKLTPRECFRLMDVDEKNIDKIQNAGISNSQQYKLAGNSIVVSCLYHIFRKLFVDKENENNQLTLF